MLSHEERIAEVKRRTAEKERQKRLRRRWISAVSGVAACLAVIVGISLSMPGIVEQIEPGTFSGFETAATMLGGSAALGYIVIGLLAFVLGVCVTILCFRVRLLNREEQPDEQKVCVTAYMPKATVQAAIGSVPMPERNLKIEYKYS